MFSAKKQGFPPLIDNNSRVLILGTMPGEQSLQLQQYYGNPLNQFWKILAAVYQIEIGNTYEEKKEFLKKHHLAVWDVLEHCEGPGSLDKNIKAAEPNDFRNLLHTYTQLQLIAFNSKKAAEWFDRKVVLGKKLTIPIEVKKIVLPSTSPAATLSLSAKVEQWRQIVLP
jgi:hypoxanthine-DNA glycosylase